MLCCGGGCCFAIGGGVVVLVMALLGGGWFVGGFMYAGVGLLAMLLNLCWCGWWVLLVLVWLARGFRGFDLLRVYLLLCLLRGICWQLL